MTTRKLVALGTALAFLSLSGIGFAADTKATGNAPAATAAGTQDPGTTQPKSTTKKKKKHTTSSSSGSSGSSATPAPKN